MLMCTLDAKPRVMVNKPSFFLALLHYAKMEARNTKNILIGAFEIYKIECLFYELLGYTIGMYRIHEFEI